MKTSQTSKRYLPLILIGLIIPATSMAIEKGEGKEKKPNPKRHEKMIEKHDTDGDGILSEKEKGAARAGMLVKYDADGDGKLSKEEKQTAKKDRGAAHRAEMLKKYDADGDGQLSKDEKAKLHEEMGPPPEKRKEMRERANKKFDKDGDGQLSESEREKAREHMQKRKGDKKGPKGPPAE